MGTYKSKYSGVEIDQILNNAQSDHMDVADNKSQISGLNQALADTKKDLQHQINTLVLESGGDSNLEVVNARADMDSHMHGTLNDRLESDFNKKADKSVMESLQSQVSTNTTKTVDLQSQIDSLVIEAGGDSNPEVVQARTDENGTTHATLKARIDSSVTDLKSDLSEINGRFVYGKNLYNPETAVDGKWINNITQSPPQIESLSYLCYNFVKITGAGDYYFKWPVGSVGENFYKTSIYDETKAYLFERNAIKISGDGNNTIVKLTISQGDISEGAFYIGYNQSISYKNELMVVKGEYPSEYIPYVSGFDMPELNVKSDQIENYPVVTPDVINFFDKSKSILGKWINNVTQSPPVIESLGYLLYNMVEVTEGDYYFKWAEASIGANAYKVSLYNSNLEYISNTNAVKISGTGNDTIVRLSITKDHILNGVKYVGYNQIISKNDE